MAAAAAPQTGLDFSASVVEPYPSLRGGAFTGPSVPESPDPLISYRWKTVRASDGLQTYTLRPQRVSADVPGSFENLDSLTRGGQNATVKGAGSIRLDFGVENSAWLEFDSPDVSGNVEMSISEYNQPAVFNSGSQSPVKTKAPAKYGNTYRLELNRELYEGVRFGWIHVRSFSRPWHISAVRLVCQIRPANYEGAFSSSDPLLTRIWYTGAYAVKLNLLQGYFGAILMERSDRISWTGDAHPSQAAALAAFGNWDFVRANLERTAHIDNGIESYSMYWILSLVDYYRYSGDEAGFDALAGIAKQKVAHAAEIWRDPPISFFGWDERLGAGFENPNIPESKAAFRFLFIRACREFAWAAGQRGQTADAANAAQMADSMMQEIRSKRGWADSLGLHAAADAINAGVPGTAEADRLYARELADPLNRLSYSPFNEYFVIQALARLWKYDEALSTVRLLWGGQIRYGGSCFFEVFRPSWNQALGPNEPVPNCQAGYTSLCHPWSSGVTKWLSEEILGIRPTAPGFSSYTVLPHLGRTLTRIAGTVPTPHGPLSAEFDAEKGSMTVTSPPGTLGMVGIPKQGRAIRQISFNGKVLWDGKQPSGLTTLNTTDDGEFVYLKGVGPGQHTFSIRYEGSIPKYTETPLRYAASFAAEDAITSGNWPRAYGSDGYVLFNHRGPNQDETHLPDYVEAATHWSSRGGRWPEDANDSRVLPSGQAAGQSAAGYLMTGNPEACKQTMTLDVKLKSSRYFQVALYFLDWEGHGRKMAVEMFDYDTKKLIAPVKLVYDFRGGKYLVYRYNRSCRFRFDHVRGDDAVVSAIFFDSGRR